MQAADDTVAELCEVIASSGLACRDVLFAEHAGWARVIALSVHRRLWARNIDPADCIQNATVGLLEAIARFDPLRGIPFRAYATPRVRGAVFNGLRALGSESGAASSQRVRERVHALAEDSGDRDELEFFSGLVGCLGLGFLLEDTWTIADEQDACAVAESSQVRSCLADGMRRLPPRQRDLLYQHYFLHRPFSDIAEEWGVTKGRISQLHHEGLRRLRQMLPR